jgi:SAM-dependent methyltransferase
MKFSFGRNWLSYSTRALDQNKIVLAREAFVSLTRGIDLRRKRFLDIGFGQGISLFLAQEAGADVYGIDSDPICAKALAATARLFPSQPVPKIEIASILDDEFVAAQRAAGGYDVVHSWGVLHHTGEMSKSFQAVAGLVKHRGFLIISIYNRHWTSPFWGAVKWGYNRLPPCAQAGVARGLYPFFYLRARTLAGERMELGQRGMDLEHDIRDWLGGYPYEYASPAQVDQAFTQLGFELLRCDATRGFTGCNEFIFRKKPDNQEK